MRWAGIGIAVVVLVVGAFVIGRETTPDPPPATYRVRGLEVIDPEGFIAAADVAFTDGLSAWWSDESRCFYSQAAAGAELHPFLRCGPVYRNLMAQRPPWDTFAVSGTARDGAYSLTLGPRIETESPLDVGEVLSRPDGAQPSDDQPTFPNATPTTDPTVRYPAEDWQSAQDVERCLAEVGVRTFAVEAIATDATTLSEVTFTTVDFDGVDVHHFEIRETHSVTDIDAEDPLYLEAVDCVRRAGDDYRFRR